MIASDTAPAAREALLKDFAANRDSFLTRLRNQFPVHYARLIALVMPRDAEPKGSQSGDEARDFMTWNLEERARAYRAVRQVCDTDQNPTGALARIRMIMTGTFYEFVDNGMEWVRLGPGAADESDEP